MDWDDGVTPPRRRQRGSLHSETASRTDSASRTSSPVRKVGSVRPADADDEVLSKQITRCLTLRDNNEPSVKGRSSVAGSQSGKSQSGHRQHSRAPSVVRAESQSGYRHHRRTGSVAGAESRAPASENRSRRGSVTSIAPDQRSRVRSVAPSDSVSRSGEDDTRSSRTKVPGSSSRHVRSHDGDDCLLSTHVTTVVKPLTRIRGHQLDDVQCYTRTRAVEDPRNGTHGWETETRLRASFSRR